MSNDDRDTPDTVPAGPFHPGELEAQFRFNDNWSEQKSLRLAKLYRSAIDDTLALFIEGQPFFFLATSDRDGNCDCSFKGTEPGEDGRPAPAALVSNPGTLVFPDYAGNHMFNSLGNLLTNAHVGLLFLDFATQSRLRVNGRAEIVAPSNDLLRTWPNAERIVRVDVQQVYWNCSRRIPADPRRKRPG
jgi:hypothetical protein